MKNEIKETLQKMGCGWFVLRLSNDLKGTKFDVNNGYAPNSIKTKEGFYRRSLADHRMMLEIVLKSNPNKVTIESVKIDQKDIIKIANDLLLLYKGKVNNIKKIKTKAARGIQFGDVANSSIRNILGSVSSITAEEIYDCEEFFDWKCPYTGRDLKADILSGKDTVAIDHIVPANRKECGLNIKGNLIFCDKIANSKKQGKNYKDFIDSLPISKNEKKERIEQIERFQKHFGYDPDMIKSILSPVLDDIYLEVCKKQAEYIKKIQKIL